MKYIFLIIALLYLQACVSAVTGSIAAVSGGASIGNTLPWGDNAERTYPSDKKQ